jgi:tetratricopeptide (TPR) repeat protein
MSKLTATVIAAGFAAFVSIALPQSTLASGSSSTTDTSSSGNAYNTALEKIKNGKYNAAIPLLQQATADDPTNADALNELGFSLRKVGRLPESLEAYQKALELKPDHIDANEYLGELYLEMKRPDLAQKQLDILTKLCPSGCEQRSDLQEQLAAFKS